MRNKQKAKAAGRKKPMPIIIPAQHHTLSLAAPKPGRGLARLPAEFGQPIYNILLESTAPTELRVYRVAPHGNQEVTPASLRAIFLQFKNMVNKIKYAVIVPFMSDKSSIRPFTPRADDSKALEQCKSAHRDIIAMFSSCRLLRRELAPQYFSTTTFAVDSSDCVVCYDPIQRIVAWLNGIGFTHRQSVMNVRILRGILGLTHLKRISNASSVLKGPKRCY
ncbi:hypothetical protein EJ08DRAFT_722871 [Tothia fuscella]|uniref:Uncharacterized protein n=1 Tax=Tothia fuscella TaxID=1048955 RepID=A0A9P4NKT0_9PEZI|nr:hypothetical protein EJ08DRAFT_722871 [Tothia fuscella]